MKVTSLGRLLGKAFIAARGRGVIDYVDKLRIQFNVYIEHQQISNIKFAFTFAFAQCKLIFI